MKLAAVVLGCALAGACEKANPSSPIPPEDIALLRDLPPGNILFVGGDYTKLKHLQAFVDSSFGTLAAQAMTRATGADPATQKAWNECVASLPHVRFAGAFAYKATIHVRFGFQGMTTKDLAACAAKAGYASSVDPDGKFVTLTTPGPGGQMMQFDYLTLADGVVMYDGQIRLTAPPSWEPSTRAELERIASRLATDNAANDKHLIELIAKTDRTKTFWFAGTGAGTPVAKAVGDVYGTVDVHDGGVVGDGTIELIDSALATQLDVGLANMKNNGGGMPAVKSVIDSIRLSRTGSTVHVGATLTADQIQALISLIEHQ
jgi:hypothetical protein